MDFTLPASAAAAAEGVGALAARYPAAYWDGCDARHRWPEELWEDLAAGGWLGLAVAPEHGGGGQGLLELAVATDVIAARGAGVSGVFVLMLTPVFGALTLQRHGTPEQQAALLPAMASGQARACFALTEPDAGSDLFGMRTRAVRRGGDYVVQGSKLWISGVDTAEWMILACRGGHFGERSRAGFTVLLVNVPEAAAAGTLTFAPLPKMSMNTVPSFAVFLDDVVVPGDRVLGEAGAGFGVLWDVLNPERIITAAACAGAADLAVTLAADHARSRKVAGQPLGSHQSVAFPLARAKAQAELARLMTFKAACRWDQGQDSSAEASMAKLAAAEAAFDAADRAVQVFGGTGFSLEAPVARLFRDARVMRTVPVSDELLLAHLARQVLRLPVT